MTGSLLPVLDPMFDSADYELRWPRTVFARELAALRTESDSQQRADRIRWLLEDAFVGSAVAEAFTRSGIRPQFGRAPDSWGSSTELTFLDRLVANLDQLRLFHEPKPYWPRRGATARLQLDEHQVRDRFVKVADRLHGVGFFQRETGAQDCPDEQPTAELSALIADRLHIADLWPLLPHTWDQDTFLALIEVLHDLVARPRARWWHDYGNCGWHFGEFSSDTGRALYRWQINTQVLAAGALGLQLAETGPDAGRLVRVTDDSRTDLVERVLATPDAGAVGRVEHAIASFRSRTATEHDKRSAVITLAGLLEERRDLIRTDLGRKDEGALFQLANEFSVRHQRRGQHSEYDPAFLNWMFWWYLATIELTDRIIERQSDRDGAVTP